MTSVFFVGAVFIGFIAKINEEVFVDTFIKEPQLFMEKCSEFETICSREYKKIEEMRFFKMKNIF